MSLFFCLGKDISSLIVVGSFVTIPPRPHPRSENAEQYRSWYKLKAWLVARRRQLTRNPLCERCRVVGRVSVANVVHHREPFKGNWNLFIDPMNHESLCYSCHNSLAQKEEKRGHVIGSSLDGRPLDPNHPWNKT